MPWKEPGEKPREPREPRGRGPWGPGRGRGPDLDAWLRKARRSLGPFGRGPMGVAAVVALVIVLWFLIGGWVSIGPQQAGVVLRFGRFERVLSPGVHLRLPSPIDQITKVEVGQPRNVGDEARLLTQDGQIALVDYNIQYKVVDAEKFLFAARSAEDAVRDAAAAAARVEVGTRPLACLNGSLGLPCATPADKARLAAGMRSHIQDALAAIHVDLGITVTAVSIQSVDVPAEVKQAFDAIPKAHDDARTARATAAADVVRGRAAAVNQAAAIKTAAAAYQRKAVADANAAVARFGQLVAQYQAAPGVTRRQLWLDAMRDVLTKNHVVVNTGSGNVVVQFPARHPAPAAAPASAASSSAPTSAIPLPASASSAVEAVTSGPALQGIPE
ncbi:MAG: FtsH protease activity modulator HflK [Rhodanobacteraceae bacterium]|nr:MAG: FtsH protease activity modulator HflK [Rhodanobacteraceae bacterium]